MLSVWYKTLAVDWISCFCRTRACTWHPWRKLFRPSNDSESSHVEGWTLGTGKRPIRWSSELAPSNSRCVYGSNCDEPKSSNDESAYSRRYAAAAEWAHAQEAQTKEKRTSSHQWFHGADQSKWCRVVAVNHRILNKTQLIISITQTISQFYDTNSVHRRTNSNTFSPFTTKQNKTKYIQNKVHVLTKKKEDSHPQLFLPHHRSFLFENI